MSPSPSDSAPASPNSPASLPPSSSLFLPPKLDPPAELPFTSLSPSDSPLPTDAVPTSSPVESGSSNPGIVDPGATPSTGSKLTRAGLQKVFGRVVSTVSRNAARIVATPVERQYGLWVAEPDEIEGIAVPASKIAYRRLPDDAKGGGEIFDVLDLVLATAGYVLRNLQLRAEIRTTMQLAEPAADATAAP